MKLYSLVDRSPTPYLDRLFGFDHSCLLSYHPRHLLIIVYIYHQTCSVFYFSPVYVCAESQTLV
jgi:hypothetical protein